MTIDMITKDVTLTRKEIANIISSAILGYLIAVNREKFTKNDMYRFRDMTLQSCKTDGFLQESEDFDNITKICSAPDFAEDIWKMFKNKNKDV